MRAGDWKAAGIWITVEVFEMKLWICVAFLVVVLAVETSANTQTTLKKDPERISLEFTSAPVTTALNVLFNGKGINFVIQPDVQGTVNSLHLSDVPFEVALKALMKSVDPPLVYKKDGDVYIISVKKPLPDIVTEDPLPGQSKRAYYDPLPSGPPSASDDVVIDKIPMNFLDAYTVKDLLDGKDTRQSGQGGLATTSFGAGFGTLGGGFTRSVATGVPAR
jgi:hypothetical protein